MTSKLALVRHGQTDWNLEGRLQGRTDIPLNDTGRAQARALGKSLRGAGWDVVLASPLGRAQETATLIAAELGAQTGAAVPELTERAFGPMEGLIMAEVSEAEAAKMLSELETREAILIRALPALLSLSQQHAGRNLMVVSHGATMRNVRDALAGHKITRGVENGEVIEIDLGRLDQLVAGLNILQES